MKKLIKIAILSCGLIQGVLSGSCSTVRAMYGIPEPQESEASIRKKITSAVDKASTELISRLHEKFKIAVLSGNSTGGDEEVVRAFIKSQGHSESEARAAVQQMDRQTVAVMAAQIKSTQSSQGNSYADYAVEDLEYNLVNAGFRLVDRQQLERIRSEQSFQMSGDVADDSAVNIGKMAGANAVITIGVNYTDGSGRLTLKALDVQTAEIIIMARQDF
jgi:cysteine synthase